MCIILYINTKIFCEGTDMDAEEFELKMKQRPHVVILGAGASVAAIPKGDKNGHVISVMTGFVDKLGLSEVIDKCNLSTDSDNLEDIYMEMYDKPDCGEARSILEKKIEEYFSAFEIPYLPTVYDYLLMGLTGKDLIATFNWDPLLVQAYERCSKIAPSLPELAFLHGNVGIGLCEKDNAVCLMKDGVCLQCGRKLANIPLLYPVKEKNYNSNRYISESWKRLADQLKHAYRVTIFGYSAPKSDAAAINMLKEAWGDWRERNLEEIEIIDIADENSIAKAWEEFIHTHHYSVVRNIFDSSIAKFPRRTCELLFDNTMNVKWIDGRSKGFTEGMDFSDIRRLLMPLMAEEDNNNGSIVLSDPYILGNKDESEESNLGNYKIPEFAQMNIFARELIWMVDEGQTLSIEEVCNHVEAGNIVQYIKNSCGFKNINITVDNVKDVNSILAERYVSEREAQNQGIKNNGLLYLLNLIIDFRL